MIENGRSQPPPKIFTHPLNDVSQYIQNAIQVYLFGVRPFPNRQVKPNANQRVATFCYSSGYPLIILILWAVAIL